MLFIQTVISGIAIGFTYAIVALGFSLTFGLLGRHSFTHGHIAMVSAFSALWMLKLGASFGISLVVAIIVGAALGLMVYFVCFRLMRQVDPMASLISSIGVVILLEELFVGMFGPDNIHFPAPFEMLVFSVGQLRIRGSSIVIMGVAIMCVVALFVLAYRTNFGRAIRTISFSEYLAHLTGVNVSLVINTAFVLGGALAGIAGVLLSSIDNTVSAVMGGPIVLKALIVMVLGGVGNLVGALVAGIGIGIVEVLSHFFVGPEFRDIVVFTLLYAVLIFKPEGLFGVITRSR
jgi:branched-chain amino acid transport system permease protein